MVTLPTEHIKLKGKGNLMSARDNSLLKHILTYSLLVISQVLASTALADVECDRTNPRVAFAARQIEAALVETSRDGLTITLEIEVDTEFPESFQVQRVSPQQIRVVGSDASGAMYGGIEVAEALKLGLPIQYVHRTQLIKKRGIKMTNAHAARRNKHGRNIISLRVWRGTRK